MRQYKVAGIFRSGMYEYDANLAFISLLSAQELLSIPNRISGYGMRLEDIDKADSIRKQLQDRLGVGFWVRSWQDLNRSLFSAMKLERTVMFIILTLIILVSSFTIISNLLLLTMEKASEIGILQAIGASPKQIGKIFLINGLILGGGGVGLGLVMGVGISLFLKHFPLVTLPADVYYIDRLPIRLSLETVISVAACAFILVLISILYPAGKARQMDPVQAIRYG
jgi:lipoprotein-releasing system permease protein